MKSSRRQTEQLIMRNAQNCVLLFFIKYLGIVQHEIRSQLPKTSWKMNDYCWWPLLPLSLSHFLSATSLSQSYKAKHDWKGWNLKDHNGLGNLHLYSTFQVCWLPRRTLQHTYTLTDGNAFRSTQKGYSHLHWSWDQNTSSFNYFFCYLSASLGKTSA